jgi:DNA-binding PadR family transcriptional regulator
MTQQGMGHRGQRPCTRLYQVTPEGAEYLHAWAVSMRETRGRLERFLSDYEAYFSRRS